MLSLAFMSVLIFASCKKDKEQVPTPTEPPVTSMMVPMKTVTLSGDNEVPGNASAATGTLAVTYDKNTKMLSYTLNYSGTTPNSMHIHNSAIGTNGGVEFTLTTPMSSPATGSVTLNATQETDLLAGKYYINVHSSAYAAGEIRAQIITEDMYVFNSIPVLPGNEVPASGSSASGTFYGLYNKATKMISYTLIYSGTTPTSMHFHNGLAGNNGGVEFTLTTPSSSPSSGTTAALSSTQETDLLAGKFYLNVHSSAYAAGEIRGQLASENITVFNNVQLNGTNESPASGSTATGVLYGTYNSVSKVLSYTYTYAGTTPTSVHFHNGAVGTNGGVVFTLPTPTSSPASGSTTALTSGQEHDLLHDGLFYINIHSSAYAAGEIRGQLMQ